MYSAWFTQHFRIWHVQGDRQTYLGTTMLEKFETGGDAPLKVCVFCDAVSTNGKGTCSQCGAPLGRPEGHRHGSMLLRTMMPMDCDILTTLHSNDRIELHRGKCGRPDDYTNGLPVVVLIVDTIVGPVFENLAGWEYTAGDYAVMTVQVNGITDLNFGLESIA